MKGWKQALVREDRSGNQEIVSIRDYGYNSGDWGVIYAIPEIRKWLEANSNYCGSELVLMDVCQMLMLSSLLEWHNFRVAWGDEKPSATSYYSNKKKGLEWKFYLCSNGNDDLLTSGTLPDDWWELNDEGRSWHLQNNDND
jgi:hypothetical protein